MSSDFQDLEWKELLELLDSRTGDIVNEDAWTEALRRIRLYARIAGATWSDVDDVAQTVILKLQSPVTKKKLRLAGSPKGYLMTTVRNAVRDLFRRRRMSVDLELSVPGVETEPLDLATQYAESESERRLLHMRYWQGLSLGEIADVLGVKYSAAAMRMLRLLARLKERSSRPA